MSRQPAGTPAGGQFAATTRGEGAVTLTGGPPVASLGIDQGDSLYLSAAEAGTDILDHVEVVHDEFGYRADGGVRLDFLDAYREVADVPAHEPLTPGSAEHDVAVQWLNDHASTLERFLTDRYGGELENGSDEWEHQRLVFIVPLDPAVDTPQTAAAKLENDTKAVQLYNESDRGTYGCPYLWAEVRRHMQA